MLNSSASEHSIRFKINETESISMWMVSEVFIFLWKGLQYLEPGNKFSEGTHLYKPSIPCRSNSEASNFHQTERRPFATHICHDIMSSCLLDSWRSHQSQGCWKLLFSLWWRENSSLFGPQLIKWSLHHSLAPMTSYSQLSFYTILTVYYTDKLQSKNEHEET